MLARWVPESADQFRQACQHAEAAGGRLDLELEINTLKNQRLWVRIIGHLELLDGRPLRAFGSVQNIQAQKLAQIALENSTEWLKLSMSMANMHAWRWDRETRLIRVRHAGWRPANLPNFYPDMRTSCRGCIPRTRQR